MLQAENGANLKVKGSICLLLHSIVSFSIFAAGQDRRKLKVKEPQKYGWKPKELLTQISQVYMRIGRADSTGAFAEAIAADKRSYSEDLFPETMQVDVLLCIVGRVLKRWHDQLCTAASKPSLMQAWWRTSTASTQLYGCMTALLSHVNIFRCPQISGSMLLGTCCRCCARWPCCPRWRSMSWPTWRSV